VVLFCINAGKTAGWPCYFFEGIFIMKKCSYVYWIACILAVSVLSGCGAAAVSGTVEQEEDIASSPSPAIHETAADTEPEKDSVQNNALPGPSYVPESALLPSGESVPADIFPPTAEPVITQIPQGKPSSPVSPTPEASPVPEKDETRPEFIYPVKNFDDDKRICLTFDDGGNKQAVKKVLEVLKKHDVKGTFFVIGKYLKTHADLWKQAIEEGHLVCNHTQNHVWLSQLNNEDAKKEITEWELTAAEVLGQEYVERMKRYFPFIRLPGGAGNDSKRILRLVSELGYVPVGWSVESYYAVLRHHDLKNESVDSVAEEVFAHFSKKIKGGSIVLLHFNPYDTEKLDDLIDAVKEKGITMHLLSECIEF